MIFINNKQKRGLSKIIIFLMVFSIIFSLAACSKSDDGNDTKETEKDTSDSGANEEQTTEEASPVPKDVTFNGEEVCILNYSYFTEDSVFVNATEEVGEVVNDAVYQRNLKVQNDLDVKFKFIDISAYAGDDFNRLVSTSVAAGTNEYDILVGVQYIAVQLATSNVLANLMEAPYIDLEKKWWPSAYINEMTIGKDNLYFLTGDISLNFIRNMSCAYFNKDVYAENFGEPDDMYKMVLDGKWTLDALDSMAKTMYKDINGNGEADDNDQYAYGVMTMNLTDHFTYDAGVRVTARDEDGIPYFVMNSERTVTFFNKIYDIFYNNVGGHVFPASDVTNNTTIPKKFMANELLFDFGWFYTSENLRDMKSDYGIIPFPKLDESQPTYLSLAHDIGPVFCAPLTCDKMETVGAVLESMAYESYKTVLPAYFEIALKLKYVRDTNEDAFTIIDMIHDNCTTDFAYVYNYALNGIGLIMRDLLAGKNKNFVSRYEKMETRVINSLNKLLDVYQSIK